MLTSRDRLWVVETDRLVERKVEVLGREFDNLIVSAFDPADGVVVVPPADVRAGLPVERVLRTELAAAGGMAGASR